MLTGELLDGRFEALDATDYDLPGVERQLGRDIRLNTPVLIDSVTSVAPTAVRRSALRAMSVRDPRLARVIAVSGGVGRHANRHRFRATARGAAGDVAFSASAR